MTNLPATTDLAPQDEMAPTVGPRRIVVGFNERPASRDALALASALCPSDGELIVVSVRPYWPELLDPPTYERALARDSAWLRREAAKGAGSAPFSTRIVPGGHDASDLKALAGEVGADLIVVGSSHRGIVGRVAPGSVGERVLSNAPCAVAVAPLGLADRELALRTIAVAYDGSKQAGVALRLGYALAASLDASVQLLGAVDFNLDLTGWQHVTREQHDEERLSRQLERARLAAPPSVPVTTRILHGVPHRVLSEAAADADLLILGSRGHYGPARRLLLGSVATAVTREAPCPTLITPA